MYRGLADAVDYPMKYHISGTIRLALGGDGSGNAWHMKTTPSLVSFFFDTLIITFWSLCLYVTL